MGLLSWLFPSEDDKLARAGRDLQRGEYAMALDRVAGLTSERAEALRAEARLGLMRLNIEVAVGLARAGDDARAEEHLALAEGFGPPGDPELKGARRAMREARAEARAEAAAARARPGVGLPGDPFGGALTHGPSEGDDPIFSLPPTDPRVRFAMAMEGYPPALRERLAALGPELATAVLAIDEGSPDHAIEVLAPFVEQDPAARFERARAAIAAGKPALAAADLEAFAEVFGHQVVNGQHTAAMLAQARAAGGRLDLALATLDAALEAEPGDLQLGGLKAHVLEAVDRLAEADELARRLVRENSRQMGLYKLMARVRLRAGKRVEAAQALEAGLTTNCTSGKCGSLPFDVEAGRMLASIYLEDRIEPRRAAELLGRIRASLPEEGWFEAYLDALTARNEGSPELDGLVRGLGAGLAPQDPRRQLLVRAFEAGA